MTEKDWAKASDVKKLLGHLRRSASARKRRLFAAACCRRVMDLIPDPAAADLLDTIERYAEGLITKRDLGRAEEKADKLHAEARAAGAETTRQAIDAIYCAACEGVGWDIAEVTSGRAAGAVGAAAPRGKQKDAKAQESAAQVLLLRDIFGNPFRPIRSDPAWLSSDVLALARGIYDERAFDRLPILADALQDAGCDSDDLLSHLRDTSAAHVRGCWALDLVLGKQ